MRKSVWLSCLLLPLGVSCGSDPAPKPDPAPTQAATDNEPAPEKVAEAPPPLTEDERLALERVFADPPLAGTAPRGVSFSPDGTHLAFLKPSPADSEVLDLFALDLRRTHLEAKPLVRTLDLVDVKHIKLSEAERMANERKRVLHKGITSYQWCGKAGDALLFPLSGELYYVKLNEGGVPTVKQLTDDGEEKLNPTCSPQATWVSVVKKGNVFVIPTQKGKAKQITKGAGGTRTFGLAEFVAQEEMGRYDGLYWSPDEKYMAVLEVDEKDVGVKVRPRIYADRTEMFEQRYPAAGEKNARVTVHVFDVAKARGRVVSIPAQVTEKDPGYIARAGFAPTGDLVVQWQSRDQKTLRIYRGVSPRYELKEFLVEQDKAWVELSDDMLLLQDGSMIWPSERLGVRQIDLLSADGRTRTALTEGEDPVLEVVGKNEKTGEVFFLRGTRRSRERALFGVTLEGTERAVLATPGMHHVVMDKTGTSFVDTHSLLMGPPKVSLYSVEQGLRAVIEKNDVPAWEQVKKPVASFVELAAHDGKTPLNGLLLEPVGRVPGQRYPVMVYVYGGPHAQVVQNGWSRRMPFFVHMTQQGYGVFMVDNRGSGNRNRAFTRAIKDRFGDLEVEDQLAAVAWLKKSRDWVDPDRIGVFGWSYGGTMSAFLISQKDTPFAAAVSVAPVTDWTLYDTHYTERYIGTPQENAEVYARASVLGQSDELDRPLLLMHGMADDNVLFENSLQLIERLQKRSAPFSLMVYPGRAHGLRGRETQLHVYRMVRTFFDQHLQGTDKEATP